MLSPPFERRLFMNRILYKKKLSGFTLIELMITVTIIGIVAAIAYPSYNQHILRTHRIEGKEMLTKAKMDQERYFSSNNTYVTDLTIMGYATNPAISEHGYYSLAVDAEVDPGCMRTTCYSMTITTVAGQPQDKDTECRKMTLTSTGRKSAKDSSNADSADCWQR